MSIIFNPPSYHQSIILSTVDISATVASDDFGGTNGGSSGVDNAFAMTAYWYRAGKKPLSSGVSQEGGDAATTATATV